MPRRSVSQPTRYMIVPSGPIHISCASTIARPMRTRNRAEKIEERGTIDELRHQDHHCPFPDDHKNT